MAIPPTRHYTNWIAQGRLAFLGVFQPLDSFARLAGITRDQYIKSMWDSSTYQGRLYALPGGADFIAVFRNQDMYEEVGLEEGPATQDELVEHSLKLLSQDGPKITRIGWHPLWRREIMSFLNRRRVLGRGNSVGNSGPPGHRRLSGEISGLLFRARLQPDFGVLARPARLLQARQPVRPGEGRLPDDRILGAGPAGQARRRHQLFGELASELPPALPKSALGTPSRAGCTAYPPAPGIPMKHGSS